jgi:hypothetical protein
MIGSRQRSEQTILICGVTVATSLLGGCENSARFALTPQSDPASDCRQMQQKLTIFDPGTGG